MADPLYDYLNGLSLSTDQKADLWDAFHDSSSRDDLTAKLQQISVPNDVKASLWDMKPAAAPKVAAPEPTFGSRLGDFISGVAGLGKQIGKDVLAGNDPVTALAQNLVGRPLEHIAQTARDEGPAAAALEGLNAIAPFQSIHEDFSRGNYGAAAFDVPMAVAGVMGLKGMVNPATAATKVLPAVAAPTGTLADLGAFAAREGIPIDAATATGNRAVAAVQHLADRSMGGSLFGGGSNAARAAEEGALAETGGRLAAKANAAPVTAEQAGQGAQGAMESVIRQQHTEAQAGYDAIRRMADDPKNQTQVVVGQREVPTGVVGPDGKPIVRTEPITESMAFPVDLSAAKKALKPMYDALLRKRELTGQLMGGEGRAMTALDAIMQAGEKAPLADVDAALGDIKAMARGADMPELRNAGQATAAQAVKVLEGEVQKAAGAAPPKVMQALQEGRKATTAKYAAADVLDALTKQTGDEPVRVFNRLTGKQDTAINLIRDVQRLAPQELPKVGRAYLDGLLDKATSEGGFSRAKGVASSWDQLGAETKKALFTDPSYIADLDRFFALAKRMEATPNPSGTAHTLLTAGQGGLILTEPTLGLTTQIGLGSLSKFLHSKAGVNLLTKGLSVPTRSVGATALVPQLLAFGGQEWQPSTGGQ
jgi:hypothetical protein